MPPLSPGAEAAGNPAAQREPRTLGEEASLV